MFYNGTKEQPDKVELKLSDAFGEDRAEDAALECKATMLNINLGHNAELMAKCQRLEEYAYFVAAVRRYQNQGATLEAAIKSAIDECIAKDKIADILRKNRAEVTNMLLTDYNEKEYRKILRKEAWEEGLEEGREAGFQAGRQAGLQAGRQAEREENRRLNKCLLRDGRLDDLSRSLDDDDYRLELMKEYKIR